MIKKLVVEECKCLRCKKKWMPMHNNPMPKACRFCGSVYWNKKIVRKKTSQIQKKRWKKQKALK